ncbi:MAG: PepSY domain-containing protein [Clostridia bacterium]|nr:PepSY domain-containing protein [Clostridia bacterium]
MGKKVYWYENEKKIELKQEEEPTVTDADVIVTDDTDNAAKDSGRKEKAFDKKDYEAKADKDGLITVEEAKAIALEKAGLTEAEVTFEKAKPDYDDGIRIYDIEFRSGNIEYDAEIDAETGEIIEFEKDND